MTDEEWMKAMTDELTRKEIPFSIYQGFPLVETHKRFQNQKFLDEKWETPCKQVIFRAGVVFFPPTLHVKGKQ